MNILSVDWSYFFPDCSKFNWDLTYFPNYDLIWHVRFSSKIKKNFESYLAREYFNPHIYYKSFWDIVLINSEPKLIVIEENHNSILEMINKIDEKVILHNFDRYQDKWLNSVNVEKIINYDPPWKIAGIINQQLGTALKKKYPNFQIIFVCRSPNKTSSWNDNHWIRFINAIEFKFQCEFDIKPTVKTERWFDLNLANQLLVDRSDYFENKKKKLMAYHYENVIRKI